MRPTSADGGELPFWGIGLPVFVVAPTGDSSVGAYSARVLITSIKGGEGCTWWAVGVYSYRRAAFVAVEKGCEFPARYRLIWRKRRRTGAGSDFVVDHPSNWLLLPTSNNINKRVTRSRVGSPASRCNNAAS